MKLTKKARDHITYTVLLIFNTFLAGFLGILVYRLWGSPVQDLALVLLFVIAFFFPLSSYPLYKKLGGHLFPQNRGRVFLSRLNRSIGRDVLTVPRADGSIAEVDFNRLKGMIIADMNPDFKPILKQERWVGPSLMGREEWEDCREAVRQAGVVTVMSNGAYKPRYQTSSLMINGIRDHYYPPIRFQAIKKAFQ